MVRREFMQHGNLMLELATLSDIFVSAMQFSRMMLLRVKTFLKWGRMLKTQVGGVPVMTHQHGDS